MCIIGMQVKSVMPLIIMDALINVRLLLLSPGQSLQETVLPDLAFRCPTTK
jgi:hypothetical protein